MKLRALLAGCLIAASLFALTGRAEAADALRARKVITLTQPVVLTHREAGFVYIAQKDGIVRRLKLLSGGGVSLEPKVVLDIHEQVLNDGEQGLLGFAIAPDGAHVYVYYTGKDGNNRVVEFPFANADADESQERLVLLLNHPTYGNHNGGYIAFGPDKLLYIGTGDGGGGGDPDRNGQDKGSLLGKMLRIDPALNGTDPYTVPASNPFVGVGGARPEIWHYGLRNPWRWSFDRKNGQMWIGDVGQKTYEEVNRVAAGAGGKNFGWNLREGLHPYNGGAKPADNTDPLFEYTHADGNCSVTGGYVYRGAKLAGWTGNYFFADFCKGVVRVKPPTGAPKNAGFTVSNPASFGQDGTGELWVLSLGGSVFRIVKKSI